MTALVGQFEPGGARCWTRTVDLKGYPTWMLIQMRRTWIREYGRATRLMVADLLEHDWFLLSAQNRVLLPSSREQHRWRLVEGVGRAYLRARSDRLQMLRIPADPPGDGEQWAYLWEHDGAALHVYVVAKARWHHIATLPVKVFTGLTLQLACDIEERQVWVEEAQ